MRLAELWPQKATPRERRRSFQRTMLGLSATTSPTMTPVTPQPSRTDVRPAGHPYVVEIDRERRGWYDLARLVRSLLPAECLEPGYYTDPDWTVRDLVAHVGTWLAEAQIQFERMNSGTYEGHDIDVDALNTALLLGMKGQPWEVAWVQAQAARTWMLSAWYALRDPSDEAAWWIRKSAAEHYAEHLARLREWTDELIARRSGETVP